MWPKQLEILYHITLSLSQRVICPQCRLGVTQVVDLSQQDMKKVRQLALIDMTALCDLLELEVKRHKTCKRKIPGEWSSFLLFPVTWPTSILIRARNNNQNPVSRLSESCLFGVPLASLVESDQKIKPSTHIPLFLQAVRVMTSFERCACLVMWHVLYSYMSMFMCYETWCFCFQLLSFLEKNGLDSEGILRVPGSQARIKVT